MYYEFARILGGSRWLIRKDAFVGMVKLAQTATPDAIQAAVLAYGQREPGPRMVGDVAVIDVCGPITYRRTWFSMFFGATAIEDLQVVFRAALSDPAAKTILFRWDSPGGLVDMVPEFADEVFAARGQKPMVSVSDLMICSAAYWIAAQTDAIYATESSEIGSVGAYLEHEEISGLLEQAGITITLIAHGDHKVDGNPYEPLSEAVKADMQEYVDYKGDKFDTAVARGRGVTKKVVLDTFGQGKWFPGEKAIKLGLADKRGTWSGVIGKLSKDRAMVTTGALGDPQTKKVLTVEEVRSLEDMPALEPSIAASKTTTSADDQGTPPDENGDCAEGYELDEDDGLCYPVSTVEASADAQAASDRDALALVTATGL